MNAWLCSKPHCNYDFLYKIFPDTWCQRVYATPPEYRFPGPSLGNGPSIEARQVAKSKYEPKNAFGPYPFGFTKNEETTVVNVETPTAQKLSRRFGNPLRPYKTIKLHLRPP